jgi:hypothetical protein
MRAVRELLDLPSRITARYAHVVDVVDMPKNNPTLFIPVKVGCESAASVGHLHAVGLKGSTVRGDRFDEH